MTIATPRISAAKLAEYVVTSSARRRRTILFQQADPPVHIVDRYKIVSHAIAKCIASKDRDEVNAALATIRKRAKAPRNERHLQRLKDAQDALNVFESIYSSRVFSGLEVSRFFRRLPYLNVSGVDVIVKPELLLHDRRAEPPRVGCAKAYISKSHPLDEDSQKYLGTLLHWFAEEHLQFLGSADPAICYIIDVFGGSYIAAPRTYRSRRKNLLSACEEIADRWPQIIKKLAEADAEYETTE